MSQLHKKADLNNVFHLSSNPNCADLWYYPYLLLYLLLEPDVNHCLVSFLQQSVAACLVLRPCGTSKLIWMSRMRQALKLIQIFWFCFFFCQVLRCTGCDLDFVTITCIAVSQDGATPLILAAQMSRVELCAFLLERGADANIQDNQGRWGLLMINNKFSHCLLSCNCGRGFDSWNDSAGWTKPGHQNSFFASFEPKNTWGLSHSIWVFK